MSEKLEKPVCEFCKEKESTYECPVCGTLMCDWCSYVCNFCAYDYCDEHIENHDCDDDD